MEHIKDLEYKSHEIVIIKDDNNSYICDIRIDDYDGHMMQGYCGLASESEAISVAKAFIEGLNHVEETGIQNKFNLIKRIFQNEKINNNHRGY